MGARKCWIQTVYKNNKTKQGKNKEMEIGQQVKQYLSEAKDVAEKLNCNVDLTSAWVFTEDNDVKYMMQSFYGESTDICIRSNVEDNWPDAIISFYKNARAMIAAYQISNEEDYGF